MNEDIIRIGDGRQTFVVCGFFTPNYRPLAERLSSDLGAANPHHFFAVRKGNSSWRNIVQMKPDIILQAMNVYPQKSVVFLDVDSEVRGPLEPMIHFNGDVSAMAKMRLVGLPFFRKKTVFHVTTRSMALRPNERTRKFLEDWKIEMREARYHQGGCEMAMRFTLMKSVGLAYCPMDPRYAGIEVGKAPPDAIVVHNSASRVHGRT